MGVFVKSLTVRLFASAVSGSLSFLQKSHSETFASRLRARARAKKARTQRTEVLIS